MFVCVGSTPMLQGGRSRGAVRETLGGRSGRGGGQKKLVHETRLCPPNRHGEGLSALPKKGMLTVVAARGSTSTAALVSEER